MHISTQHQSLMIRNVPCGSCNAFGYRQCHGSDGNPRYYPHATRIKKGQKK